jgi:hypothetical protein
VARRSAEGRPRWVTVLVAVGILVVLLVAVLHLAGGGPRHGLPDHGSAGTPR